MFPDNICQNIDILVVINVQKNNFGFHSNRKTQGQKHQVNNLYFINQVCQMILRHLNTFLHFRLLFHEPHCRDAEMSTWIWAPNKRPSPHIYYKWTNSPFPEVDLNVHRSGRKAEYRWDCIRDMALEDKCQRNRPNN